MAVGQQQTLPTVLARLASVLWLGPLPLYADAVQSRPTKQNQPHTLPFSRCTTALIQHKEKRSESTARSSIINLDSLGTACEVPLSAWQWSSPRSPPPRHHRSPTRRPDALQHSSCRCCQCSCSVVLRHNYSNRHFNIANHFLDSNDSRTASRKPSSGKRLALTFLLSVEWISYMITAVEKC